MREAVEKLGTRESFESRWHALEGSLGQRAAFTDIKGAIKQIADRDSPESILTGLDNLSREIYFTMRAVVGLGRE